MKPAVVLVRPQFSGNLGSVARAMKNMGLEELRLVQPEALPTDAEARKMAVHAQDVLANAQVFASLPDALQDFHSVVGTSRRVRQDRNPFETPKNFFQTFTKKFQDQRVAILFGAEDTGLTNQDLDLCQHILSIPTNEECPSLNLAQAVMVIAYEWAMAQSPGEVPFATDEISIAPFEQREAMYQDLQEVLLACGFLRQDNREHMMRLLRNLFQRSQLSEEEVKIFRGICRQLRWWGGQGSSEGTT